MLLHLAKFVQFLFEPVRFGSHIALHTPQAGVWTLNDIGWSDFASLHVFHGQEWQAAFLHAKIEEKTLLASTTLVARRPPSRDHALVSWVCSKKSRYFCQTLHPHRSVWSVYVERVEGYLYEHLVNEAPCACHCRSRSTWSFRRAPTLGKKQLRVVFLR